MKPDNPEFSYIIDLLAVKKQDNYFELKASETECLVLAKRFNLLALKNLYARIKVCKGHGLYSVTGSAECEIKQLCGVTLEEFWSPLQCDFEEEVRIGKEEPQEGEWAASDAVNYSEDSKLDLGQMVADYISLSIDPFPRKPGVEFSYQEFDPEEKENPFTVLKNTGGNK